MRGSLHTAERPSNRYLQPAKVVGRRVHQPARVSGGNSLLSRQDVPRATGGVWTTRISCPTCSALSPASERKRGRRGDVATATEGSEHVLSACCVPGREVCAALVRHLQMLSFHVPASVTCE